MHILRSERLGVIWLGVAFLACLCVELWGVLHPVEVEPLRAEDLLFALGEMPGYTSPPRGPGQNRSWDAGSSTEVPHFPNVQGEVHVHELDSSGWVALGLSPRQARGAMRYAKALGGIRNQGQLERMRSLPEGWLEHHGPHLRFPTSQPFLVEHHKKAGSGEPHPQKQDRLVDINRADSMELVAIRGVGPWVAGQILRARRQWGGIADLGLLAPALNGWDSLAQVLKPSFSCRAEDVYTQCADTLSVEDWKSLPLIGYKEARLLEKVARHHPGNLDAVLRHPVLDSSQQRVLALYVTPCQGLGWD